ncbi:thioredoxin, mitochondrial-like [Argonauta hians]
MAGRQFCRLVPLCRTNFTRNRILSSLTIRGLHQKPLLSGERPQSHLPLSSNKQSKPFSSAAAALELINIQDEADFQKRVLDSTKPVIVDFHATWCGPCKLLAPRLEKVCDTYKDDVILAKVDIDDNTELAMKYNVSSVPTVIGVRNGKTIDQFIGLQPDDLIEDFIEKLKH